LILGTSSSPWADERRDALPGTVETEWQKCKRYPVNSHLLQKQHNTKNMDNNCCGVDINKNGSIYYKLTIHFTINFRDA